LNIVRLISVLLIATGLIILNLNIVAYSLLSESNVDEQVKLDGAYCNTFFNKMNSTPRYNVIGRSLVTFYEETVYEMISCDGRIVNVRVYKPLSNITRAVIIMHDYGSSFYDVLGLALRLVNEENVVALMNLPFQEPEVSIKLDNIERNWIYIAVCSIRNAVTLLMREYNVSRIGLFGLGFGGVATLLTAIYDNRVDYIISQYGIGDYENNLKKASLINYFVNDVDKINYCLDPVYELERFDKPTLIILATNDELSTLNKNLLNSIARNNNILISIVPNVDRYYIPREWELVIKDFISKNNGNNTPSTINIHVENHDWELIVENNDHRDIYILSRPLIPGFEWSVSTMQYSRIRLVNTILPQRFIIVDSYNHRLIGIYDVYFSPGLIISVALLITGLILEKKIVFKYVKHLSILEYLYIVSTFSIIFYNSYPSIYSPGRFHVSLNIISDVYFYLAPIVTYLVLATVFVNPILFTLMFTKQSRGVYTLLVSLSLFNYIVSYTFLLFLGLRFKTLLVAFPTYVLIPFASSMILDYIIRNRET